MVQAEESHDYKARTTVIMVITTHVFMLALRFHALSGGHRHGDWLLTGP